MSSTKRSVTKSPSPAKEMEFMDMPDDVLREIFKKTGERNMLVVNKKLTNTIRKESDMALFIRWLKKRATDNHEKEAQFRDMLRRGLDPNTGIPHPKCDKEDCIVPLIIVLATNSPLLAKILLRQPGLNHKAYTRRRKGEKYIIANIPTVLFVAPQHDVYHDDIEYVLETFPDEVLRDTFKVINLQYVVQVMHLKINVLDNILRRGYFSLDDIKKYIQQLESALSGEPKDSATYIYLNDALMSLIYFRDLPTSKGGGKRRRQKV